MKFTSPEEDKILLEEFYRKYPMAQPPALEDLICNRQEQFGARRGLSATQILLGLLIVSFLFFAVTLTVAMNMVNEKFERAEKMITQATVVMDKLPESIDRAQKLLDRTDESIKRGIAGIKEATPEVSKGLLDGIRKGLNKDPQ